jgi:ribonuclease T2
VQAKRAATKTLGPPLLALGLAACDAAAPQPAVTAAQCYTPAQLPVQAASPPDDIPDARATGHVLALSWSPEFCRFRADAPEHAGQCRDNRFGFILHGLWPQSGAGPHPRACAAARPVPQDVLRAHYCMTPSARLMQHEWAAHGTCAWEDPAAYYADAAMLWDEYERPDLFGLSRREGLTAGDVRGAFVAANDAMPPEAVGLDVNNRGWLEEVFLCLDLAYEPRPCAAREYGAADTQSISIWRGGGR